MVQVHGSSVAEVVKDCRGKPFECLASVAPIVPLDIVDSMSDCDNVHGEDQMMNSLLQLNEDLGEQTS